MKKKPRNFLNLLNIIIILAACTVKSTPRIPTRSTNVATPLLSANPREVPKQLALARAKIKHIVIIMQENRSFDHYFGTYPGADGIPMQNGAPTVCAADPITEQCIPPFHDSSDINYGGPHSADSAVMDINNGKTDGFIKTVYRVRS